MKTDVTRSDAIDSLVNDNNYFSVKTSNVWEMPENSRSKIDENINSLKGIKR